VFIGPDGVVGEYRKARNFPIAESFSLSPGIFPPPSLPVSLPPPPHVNKTDWSNSVSRTRTVYITTLICNDLSFPSLLSSFGSLGGEMGVMGLILGG
jgi:predicted amidohydrolase